MTIQRGLDQSGAYFDPEALSCGLEGATLVEGVNSAYRVLDTIDAPLRKEADMRLAKVVELANLSSMLGNILAGGIVRSSGEKFRRADPHKYQDLRAVTDDARNVEIKVALETNKPKGHLAKPGDYLTFRYVLGDSDGRFTPGTRGDTVWIWEIRCGHLDDEDFSESNTDGDSGKTAVVTTAGIKKLRLVYCDSRFMPFKREGHYWNHYGPSEPQTPALPL